MIYNQTLKTRLSSREIIATTFFSQLRGLMFHRKQNLILILPEEQSVALHMFFVFFPVDVLVLDKNRKIVEIKRNFTPFTFWTSQQKGKYVVELAFPGTYGVGDRLTLKKGTDHHRS